MQLKLKELQTVAKATIKEERSLNNLRDEMFRVLGPSVMVPGSHAYLATQFNERLDLLESTGRFPRGSFKNSVLLEVANSGIPEVRKLAARLLPERHIVKYLTDSDSSVRCAAARRLPYGVIKEAVRHNIADENLRAIARQKRLTEAGLPNPKPVTEPFDIHGEEPLGDAVKGRMDDDFTDEWYYRMAHKLCAEYGNNLEGQWEEALATRVASSYRATSHVKLDREKLLKALYACIKEREDAVLGEGSLRMLARRLRSESHLDEGVMPVIAESVADPVADLLESFTSSQSYVEKAEALFGVRKSTVPATIKKHRLGESNAKETSVPVLGRLPAGETFNSKIETALDRYVDSWNSQQKSSGEPYRLSWSPHPAAINMVGFNLELK